MLAGSDRVRQATEKPLKKQLAEIVLRLCGAVISGLTALDGFVFSLFPGLPLNPRGESTPWSHRVESTTGIMGLQG
jgi:hypothetical protein